MKWKTYLLGAVIIAFFAGVLSSVNISDNIISFAILEDAAPPGFEFIPPGNESQQSAQQALNSAELQISEMRQSNFTTTYVDDVFDEANMQYKQGNYTEVLKMAELISYVKKKKIEFLDEMELIEIKDKKYKEQKIDTSAAEVMVDEAMDAFNKDQMVDAERLMRQADSEMENAKTEKQRQETIAHLGKSFFVRYWWEIIIAVIIIAVASRSTVKKIIKKNNRKKWAGLKGELAKTEELIKSLQKRCFIDKKISVDSYKNKTEGYEKRIAEIKHTIPVIEAQLKGSGHNDNNEKNKNKNKNDTNKKNKKNKKGILVIKR